MSINEQARRRLCELIAKYGVSLAGDARRCEALLRDLCGEQRRELNVLVAALKERIPTDLLSASDGIPKELLLARFTVRLHEDQGVIEELAKWAVESWALALGRIGEADLALIENEYVHPRAAVRPVNHSAGDIVVVASPSHQAKPGDRQQHRRDHRRNYKSDHRKL
jgi:hypothetical protein